MKLQTALGNLPQQASMPPCAASGKVVVLDDDPTGTQTVQNLPVLTTWSLRELVRELESPGQGFFMLTNSRALPPAGAIALNREVGSMLQQATERTGKRITVLSRSDSTLRGHFPAETDALAVALGGRFDGTLLIPAFFAGGRLTIGDVHYVTEGDELVPAGQTEFARDASFGYRSSNLRDYVEEKTGGRVAGRDVVAVSLDDIRRGGPVAVAERLATLTGGGFGIVNAAAREDLNVVTHALSLPRLRDRRFLFRTAADFVAALFGQVPQPPLPASSLRSGRGGGLLVAGSYVAKTSRQLEALFAACPSLVRVEADVLRLADPSARDAEIARCRRAVDAALEVARSAALFTSRRLHTGSDAESSLEIGARISTALVEIVAGLEQRPDWLVAKGGITSSDVATKALGIRRAMVLGQALPGVPVWRCGPESKWPDLAYVVFPGNVGAADALARLTSTLLAV